MPLRGTTKGMKMGMWMGTGVRPTLIGAVSPWERLVAGGLRNQELSLPSGKHAEQTRP
jgi:hypothetical protein